MTVTEHANENRTKPLGGKAYGSIGHLPQSRLGSGDWHVHVGQARICLERPRKGDRITVSEKLDGACMTVANIDGQIVGVTRAGYAAAVGLYEHLRAFAPWVAENEAMFSRLLQPGERVVGEWLAMAHGTIYDPESPLFRPFVAFDIIQGKRRALRDEFRERCDQVGLPIAACVYDGPDGCSIEEALCLLGPFGKHGAMEEIEGAVWRVEREGEVDFLAKFVRAGKQDGKYLPGISGKAGIWLTPPGKMAA